MVGAATAAALVLLFSYRTSLHQGVASAPENQAQVISAPAADGSGAGGSGPAPLPGSSDKTVTIPAPGSRSGAGSSSGAGSRSGQGSGSAAAAPAAPAPSPARTVVNGAVENTEYGPVQVQVTVAGGKITEVKTLQHPYEEQRSRQISAIALPQLRAEALAAQSSRIDGVSGATYTTEGYIASLQSALDAAHFTRA